MKVPLLSVGLSLIPGEEWAITLPRLAQCMLVGGDVTRLGDPISFQCMISVVKVEMHIQVHSNWYFQMVTHLDTNQDRRSLTLEISRVTTRLVQK